MSNTDEELLAIIQSRKPTDRVATAWDHLIEKYQPILLTYALSGRFWNGNQEAAEDTVQNAWIKIFNNINAFKQTNFAGWTYTILGNQFIDDYRKNKRVQTTFKLLPLGMQDDSRNLDFDQVERLMNRIHAEPSAEQTHLDDSETSDTRFRHMAQDFLSRSKASFFLGYQEDPNPKEGKEKTRFLRVKGELISNMIKEWVSSGRSLDTIMNPRQANVLTARFSLKRRNSEIFHDMGITNKLDLDDLISGATERLIEALSDEIPDD